MYIILVKADLHVIFPLKGKFTRILFNLLIINEINAFFKQWHSSSNNDIVLY